MTERAKLKWHCRRGIRELDLLLDGFLENRYESLSPEARASFARLLDCENEDLWAWILEGETPQDEELAGVVREVRERKVGGA